MSTMRGIWKHPTVRKIHGFFVQLLFFIFAVIQLPFCLIIDLFLQKSLKPKFWRMVSFFNSKLLRVLGGIIYHYNHPHPTEDGPYIYVSNHGTKLDGFLCFEMVGPNVDFLVGPRGMFPFPFDIFSFRSGAIDVMRDKFDYEKYAGASSPKRALEKLEHSLKSGRNVMIFAEGHVEHSDKLHYIHTGAARLALKTGRPIVPMVLTNEHQLIGGIKMSPGTINIRFGKPIYPEQILSESVPRASVEGLRTELMQSILDLLPRKYAYDFYQDGPSKHVGVFLDIDKTIYKGYSMKDFYAWLLERGEISTNDVRRMQAYFFMNKLGLVTHIEVMEQAGRCIAGWSEEKISRLVDEFYGEIAHWKFHHDLLSYIYDHKKFNHRMILVSEAITPLARKFRELVGAKEAHGTELEIKNGEYTGRIVRLMRGEEKRDRVKHLAENENLVLQKSYAYGDSEYDVPMLKLVGNPVVVKPHSSGLYTYAKRRGWEVVQ